MEASRDGAWAGDRPYHAAVDPLTPASQAEQLIRSTRPEADASLYLHPQTLARLSSLELRAKMIVEGISAGAHRSPYRGVSLEFAQHRPYVAGDDLRHLDWKVFARTDRLQIKQYQQETNLDLVLLVDCSGSMNFGTRSFEDASGSGRKASPDGRPYWSKYDHATALAAAMAYITLEQGDRVGLGIYADQLTDAIDRSSQRATWRKVIGALSAHPVERPSNIRRVIDQTVGKLNNRCLIVLISDFFEPVEDIKAALARLRHRHHDVICFQVLDRSETEFDMQDPLVFEGAEGEAAIRVDPRSLREAYLKALTAHTEELRRVCRGFEFDWHRLGTHDWLGPPLAEFVAYRNAKLRRTSA